MDESTVRDHAQAHAEAVVAGDVRRAAQDLAGDATRDAPGVMQRLPNPLRSAEVLDTEPSDAGCVARIRYRGSRGDVVVGSRWDEVDGRPKIVALRVE